MYTIDHILINTLQVLLPFTIYLFYATYKKTNDEREDSLVIIIAIISSLYIAIKYNSPIFNNLPLLSINVPLIIAYYKKNNTAIAVSSLIIVLYNYNFYNGYFIMLSIEYSLYYVIYYILKVKNINTFIVIFALIKVLCLLFISHNFLKTMILGIAFIILSFFVLFLLKQGENILSIHKLSKEIEHDKQVRTALFRITHEIKNPIAVCKGYLDMFDINNKNHAKKYIPIMKEEIDKVLILLEDFLAMNKIKLNKEILDINLLLEELVSSYKLFWQEKNIKTNINILDEEVYIEGDYNRLRQVFLNIIKNSMEALKENPYIEIWTELDDNIKIYFKDNGKGIPDYLKEKIKEPFFTTKPKGTGLGVSLANEIIKAHGGIINYYSKENEFTLVEIILPTKNLYT